MTGSKVRLRRQLDTVPSYQPGRPAVPRPGVTGYKLSSNENPYPPLPSVLHAVQDAATSINRYPDMMAAGLRQALAAALDVPAEHIAAGPGSSGVLGQIIQAACDPAYEVVFAWRSFEAYPIITGLAGAISVQVPLDSDGRHRLDAMAAAITQRTRVVLICTPNNPTGPAIGHDELAAFLDGMPRDVLTVIDEAYHEFVTDPAAADALALYRARPNVALLRTFSKAHGLAGLRVGYAIAHEPVASALRKTAVPFGVNSLAQAATLASLAARQELQDRVAALVGERTRVASTLRAQGWPIPDSQANFIWLPLGQDSPAFAAAAQEAGLAVRQFGDEGVRVTIGETQANDALIGVARQVRSAISQPRVPAWNQAKTRGSFSSRDRYRYR